jgi:ADP-ribose pyrophosphatase YjhB (NUDIX family)
MAPSELFRYCPRCGRSGPVEQSRPFFQCDACGFLYYFNPVIAVGAILVRPDGRILFVQRAKDPAKGKLGVPGGFVDFGESAEAALRREIREEVNLEAATLEYLCSQPNDYPYKGVTYQVLDFYFIVRVDSADGVAALDDVDSVHWLEPSKVEPAELAFDSERKALELFLSRRRPS